MVAQQRFGHAKLLQTGTSLFPVRQASRRSYRIGQTQDVEVRFLAYSDTLQTAQLLLMAKKLKAAAAAEGSITAEGLRVLAGDDDGSIALVQMLLKGMDGLKSAEAIWRQAAQLGTMPARLPTPRRSRRWWDSCRWWQWCPRRAKGSGPSKASPLWPSTSRPWRAHSTVAPAGGLFSRRPDSGEVG